MAITGPIQVPFNLSGLSSLTDVVRYLSAFSTQVTMQFNNSLGTRSIWGVVGASGAAISGASALYGSSAIALGHYHIQYRRPFVSLPATIVTMHTGGYVADVQSATFTGFDIFTYIPSSGTPFSAQFSFVVMGAK